MKRFLPFALVLSLLFSACVSATPAPRPTTTQSETPNPTATATATATAIPTPDVKTQTIQSLEKIDGITVKSPTEIEFKGAQIPGASINAETGDLNIQIGEQQITLTNDVITKRLASKEGSLVVYDEKGIDSYNNPDMSQWTKVEWVFSPTAETERWGGWVERSKAIAPDVVNEVGKIVADREKPIIVGDTYAESKDFLKIQLAFLQPFAEDTVLPHSTNNDYQDRTTNNPPPFTKIEDMSKFGIRNGVNFWILKANPTEHRESDTGGIVEQVMNPNNKSDIQVLNFASGDTSSFRISEYFKRYSAFGTLNSGYLMPLYSIGGPLWTNGGGRMANLRQYYANAVGGYVDETTKTPINPLGDINGKIYTLVQEWRNSQVVPDELQQIWLLEQEWFIG